MIDKNKYKRYAYKKEYVFGKDEILLKGISKAKENECEVYQYLVDYTKKNLFPPTVGEIRDGTSIQSTGTIYSILCRLENKGLIEVIRETPRGIKLKGYKIVKGDQESDG